MARGAKELTSRDWIFGSRPRRLVLQFVLANKPGPEGWTKTALAAQAEVHPKGGIDEHVRGLVALELLHESHGRYWPVQPSPALGRKLQGLLRELEQVPENRIADEARARSEVASL
jgi:hypothetical protein